MKKLAASLMAVVLVNTAFAGTVLFNGPTVGHPGGTLTFDVSVASDFAAFNSVGMVIASTGGLNVTDFSYSDAFNAATTIGSKTTPAPFNPPRFPGGSELNVGGIAFLSNTMSDGIVVGTVTVGIPAGVDPNALAAGIDLFVNSARDGGASGITSQGSDNFEPLTGLATITPEPATLSLLGLAVVGLLRRRRSA